MWEDEEEEGEEEGEAAEEEKQDESTDEVPPVAMATVDDEGQLVELPPAFREAFAEAQSS